MGNLVSVLGRKIPGRGIAKFALVRDRISQSHRTEIRGTAETGTGILFTELKIRGFGGIKG